MTCIVLRGNVVQMTFYASQESCLTVHMSFGSEVVATRFNGRKERVNIMTGISHVSAVICYP